MGLSGALQIELLKSRFGIVIIFLSLLGLRMLDPSLSPPSTLAEFFWCTCLRGRSYSFERLHGALSYQEKRLHP